MDPRLQVVQNPRQLSANIRTDIPLVPLAWRELQSEHDRNRAQTARLNATLADLGEEAFRLDRLAKPAAGAGQDVPTEQWSRTLATIVQRLRRALARLDVTVYAPEGEVFDAHLMELFENVAQQPDPEADQPRVAEVIDPAIVCEGRLLRQGKVVITVPGKQETVREEMEERIDMGADGP